jgi:hypothetical protein
VITIDTEPDNQWDLPAPGSRLPELTFANTRGLGAVSAALRRWGVKATWLTSYSVARDAPSVGVLKEAAAGGDEIGSHLHAWETPPFVPEDAFARPYIYEYDARVRLAKLESLTSAVADAFGVRPVSYRAGRWGVDELEYKHLESLGYLIDSTVVPGYDFRGATGLKRGGPDFRRQLDRGLPEPYKVGNLWEVPASVTTAGGICGEQLATRLAQVMFSRTDIPSRALRKTLFLSRVSRLIWLRPFWHPAEHLIEAALAMTRSGASVINVMFHSSETCPGTSPRTRSQKDVDRFYHDMEALVSALLNTGCVVPRTLRDAMTMNHESR